MNFTVVADGNNNVNGILSSSSGRKGVIQDLIDAGNTFFDDQNALLRLECARVTTVKDNKRFNMSNAESARLPSRWKRRGELDMIFINAFDAGHVGLGKVTLCTMQNGGRNRSFASVARTFVREIGHYFGLKHQTDPKNIMTQSSTGDPLTRSRMTDDQIQDIHQKLARNLSRKADRIE